MKRFRVGKPDYMWISIQTRRAGDGNSAQNLQYFAGPSYVFARHRCIVWHGGAELDIDLPPCALHALRRVAQQVEPLFVGI
jgi:hypothetical protein